jgi:hypothetical protein
MDETTTRVVARSWGWSTGGAAGGPNPHTNTNTSVNSSSSTSTPSFPSTSTTNRHNALAPDFDYDGKAYDNGPLVQTDIPNSSPPAYSRASDSYQQQSALKECVTTEKPSRPVPPASQNRNGLGARHASPGPMGLPISPTSSGRVRPSNLVHRSTLSSGSSDYTTDGYTTARGGLVRNPSSASSASSSTSYSTSSSNSSYAPPPHGPTPPKANLIENEGGAKDRGRDGGMHDEELRPTTFPRSGCPLLKDGKLLVFGWVWCPKCVSIRSSSTFCRCVLSLFCDMLCH